MRAIVGLGNPGTEYEGTRHNAGFLLVDALAEKWDFPKFRRPWRWRARVTEGTVRGEKIVLVKPQTYMNRSGGALSPLLSGSDFDPSNDLLIVVDEVALVLGSARIRPRGSAGGHNGLKSIAGKLQSEEYPRLRIGVGPRPDDIDQSEFVLGEFETEEREKLDENLPHFVQIVESWIQDGMDIAMNRYNRKGTERD